MSASTSVPQAGRPRPNGDSCDSAMLDALLAQAPVGFAFIDPDLRLRKVSSSLAEMTGGALADQVGHALDRVWPPGVAATAQSAVRSVLATGRPVLNQITAAGATHGAGDAAAEEVRRTNERYRSLVQAGNQVVWVTDPSGQVSEDSPEWRWITGQSVEEYLSDGWLAAIHADDRDRVERDWLSCTKTGAVFDGSYRVRTKTGSYRHYDVRAVPIERDGAIVEWMGASTDVTSQREADEMRGRLTEQLSAAALRTSRLQQATS